MRKITFTNEANGRTVSFSTDTPQMFLAELKTQLASTAVVYKPAEYDGQDFISANLNARTIQLMVNFTGISGGKYSYPAAADRWREIQSVFIPGQYGTLVWTDGTHSRQIRCRTDSLPEPTLKSRPVLFEAAVELTADKPLWYDTKPEITELTGEYSRFTINNDCGIAVPFVVTVSGGAPIIFSNTLGKGIAFARDVTGTPVTADMDKCTVTNASGVLVNNLLSVNSEFFRLVPGENVLQILPGVGESGGTGRLVWHKAYLSEL